MKLLRSYYFRVTAAAVVIALTAGSVADGPTMALLMLAVMWAVYFLAETAGTRIADLNRGGHLEHVRAEIRAWIAWATNGRVR